MSKFHPVSLTQLIKTLKKFGFEGPFSGGKHLYMVKQDCRLTLPNPHKSEISIDLLLRILKQAGISKEEWINIL
jgi:predicted RNA binding protein YcfA (HicA-like mRNA interferase family)